MRTRSMTALTVDIQREWPGATVWGKGDLAHQASPSDHNEDDTPGSRPEQTDADNVPEHRALDIPMLGPITMATLRVLRDRLISRPANRVRLRYVILEQTIWRKRNGWVPEVYDGEYHDHLHVSQDVADDENGAGWDISELEPPQGGEEDDMKPILGRVLPASTVWKGYGVPGSLMALHSQRAYQDVKSSLGATELHYAGGNAGDANTLVDVLGTLPRTVKEDGTWETDGENYGRSVEAVRQAG